MTSTIWWVKKCPKRRRKVNGMNEISKREPVESGIIFFVSLNSRRLKGVDEKSMDLIVTFHFLFCFAYIEETPPQLRPLTSVRQWTMCVTWRHILHPPTYPPIRQLTDQLTDWLTNWLADRQTWPTRPSKKKKRFFLFLLVLSLPSAIAVTTSHDVKRRK